jgi:Rho-binding antiterminator
MSYQPIDCNYYDRLEAWATMKTVCLLVFLDDNDVRQEVSGLIADLYTLNKAEYLRMDNGLTLRLDRLLSVNGVPVPGQCG